tara:strand:+ start:356 stop:1126 length:771 start_codon:yes stop_codon:yes gene_type:complete
MLTALLIITLLSFSSTLPIFLLFTRNYTTIKVHNLVLSISSTIAIFINLLLFESKISNNIFYLFLLWVFCLLFITVISWKHKNINLISILLIFMLGIGNFVLISFALININFQYIPFLIFGGLILSNSCFSLIVGHSYLDDVDLPISLIKNINKMFFVMVILRLILDLIVVLFYNVQVFNYSIPIYEFIFGYEGIFLWTAFFFGIIFPICLSFLSHKTINIESTLSATGLLYVLVVCIFMSSLIFNYYAIQFKIFL